MNIELLMHFVYVYIYVCVCMLFLAQFAENMCCQPMTQILMMKSSVSVRKKEFCLERSYGKNHE